MFCNYNFIFQKTPEYVLQWRSFLCKIATESIEQHSCNACKYANIKKDYEMGYGVYEVYCYLDGSLKCDCIQDNCDKWELSKSYNAEYQMLRRLQSETITDPNKAEAFINAIEKSKNKNERKDNK